MSGKPEVRTQVTRYSVCCLPEDNIDHIAFEVSCVLPVTARGATRRCRQGASTAGLALIDSPRMRRCGWPGSGRRRWSATGSR